MSTGQPDKTDQPLTYAQALQAALDRLDRQERSGRELREELQAQGASPRIADEVTASLVAQGAVDDRRLARFIIRRQAERGKGALYIMQKLRQRGLPQDAGFVREALSELRGGVPEAVVARELVIRHYPRADQDPREARRAYAGLVRRGFAPESAREALLLNPDEAAADLRDDGSGGRRR